MLMPFLLRYEIEINKINNSIEFKCNGKNNTSESYFLSMNLEEFRCFHSIFENENSIDGIYNKIQANKKEIKIKKNNIDIYLEIQIENTLVAFNLKYNNNNKNIYKYTINFIKKYSIFVIIAVLAVIIIPLIVGSLALDKTRKLEKIVNDLTKNFEILENVENIEKQLNQKVDKIYIDNINDNSIPYNEKPFSYYVNLKNDFTALEAEFNKIKMLLVSLGENSTKHFNILDTYITTIKNDLSNLKDLKNDYLINKNNVNNNILILNTSLTDMNNNFNSKFSIYNSDIINIKNIIYNDSSILKDLKNDFLINKNFVSNDLLILNTSLTDMNNNYSSKFSIYNSDLINIKSIIINDLSILMDLKNDFLINKNIVSNDLLILNTSLIDMNNNYNLKFSNYNLDIVNIKNNLNKLNNDSIKINFINNELSILKNLTNDYIINKILILNNSLNLINHDIIYINDNIDLLNDLESDIILDINEINLKLKTMKNNISINTEKLNILSNENDNSIKYYNTINKKINDNYIILTNHNNSLFRIISEISILKDFKEKSLSDYNFFYNKHVKHDNDINNLNNSLNSINIEECKKCQTNSNGSKIIYINIIYLIIINSIILL